MSSEKKSEEGSSKKLVIGDQEGRVKSVGGWELFANTLDERPGRTAVDVFVEGEVEEAVVGADMGVKTVFDAEKAGKTIFDVEEAGKTVLEGGDVALETTDENVISVGVGVVEGSATDGKTRGASQTVRAKQLRRYRDGVLTTAMGDRRVLQGDEQQAFALPYSSTDVIGRLGAYDLLGEIGEGGMGKVYKAYSLNLCRFCAIKVMKVGKQINEATILRFQNEAMLAGRLRHPNIISVFDAGEEPGTFYFVMDWIEGKTFQDLIDEESDEAMRRGLQILSKCCRALDYAHRRGIVHRDVKPDNILIDQQGEPYIMDFGIAKDREQGLNLTATKATMGTPYYMSPEQANGEVQHVGPLSDVYSLGATMFHLLTGRVPFVGDTLFSLMMQVISNEVEVPSEVARRVLGRKIPQELDVLCLKAMEKEAGRRYASAADFADDIDAYLAEKPIKAHPLTRAERFQKLMRRNRAVFAGVASVLGLLLVMVLAFGSLLVFNLHNTGQALRDQDRKAALDQAATLQRAIAANMVEGRADIVRELVSKLRKDQTIASIEVVRLDKTYAYTDLSTRQFVEKRLSDPKVLEWIKQKHPKLLSKVSELKRIGFLNIDQAHKGWLAQKKSSFGVEKDRWNDALTKEKAVSFMELFGGKKVLTVYWPVPNGKPCQACHGETGKAVYAGYGWAGTSQLRKSNRVRAVLVVRRTQEDVEQRIAENRRSFVGIGLAATFGLLCLSYSTHEANPTNPVCRCSPITNWYT